MGDKSVIEWTDATVNFWWGCTKVGPGCDHCYAERFDKRVGGSHWGLDAPRRKIKSAVSLIHRLDNEYAAWAADHACGQLSVHCGLRRRVFIQSMSDIFDLEAPLDWFAEAWTAIEACERVTLQIVTKRISVIQKRLAAIGESTWPRHAGLIISVVNQTEADRDIPRLLELKQALDIPWVGLSVEPMLGPIDFSPVADDTYQRLSEWYGPQGFDPEGKQPRLTRRQGFFPKIDWVICGGESGPGARPMNPSWARSTRDQCVAAGVPFFFKQWGEWKTHVPAAGGDLGGDVRSGRVRIVHRDEHTDDELCKRSFFKGDVYMARVGKKAAGRLLDGVEHNAMPETSK